MPLNFGSRGVVPGRNRRVFQANTDYYAGDMIVQDGATVYALADFTSGATFDAADWVTLPVPQTGIPGAEKGAPNGVATLGADGTLTASQRWTVSATQPWDRIITVAGNLTLFSTRPWRPPYSGTLEGVRAELLTGPSSRSAIFNVQKNGVSMFTTPAARPQVPADTLFGSVAVPDTKAFAAGDALTVICEQIGVQPSGATITPVSGSFTSQASTAATTTYDVLRASAAQTGDLSIVRLRTTVAAATVTSFPGWTAIGTASGSGTTFSHWFYRVHDTSTGPWTATFSTAVTALADRQLWRGVDTTTPFHGTPVIDFFANSTGPFTPTDFSTTADGKTIIYIAGLNANRAASLPNGYTARRGFAGTGGATDSPHVADKVQATAGAVGTDSFTLATAATVSLLRAALNPIPAPPTWSPGADAQITLTGLRS